MSTSKIAYDPALDDEEWRETNFTEQEILASQRGTQPTYEQLLKHAQRFGPEGVLESAIHLTQNRYRQLARKLAELGGKNGRK